MIEELERLEAAHVLTVHWEQGDYQYLTLKCLLTGSDRPCAIIDCPVDHEDTDRGCIEAHGAVALDKCWAQTWYEAGDRDSLDTQDLVDTVIPVTIEYDEGVVVHDAGPSLPALLSELRAAREALHDCRRAMQSTRESLSNAARLGGLHAPERGKR